MLISFEEIRDMLQKYSIDISGAFHIGAHECEEMEFYNKMGIPAEKIVWIDAIASKVDNAIQRGIPNIYHAVVTDKDGEEVIFNIANNFQSSSVLPLGTHLVEHPGIHYTEKVVQNSITINSFFDLHGLDGKAYEFWNFDIQGAELMALKGATKYIAYAKAIYLEVNEKELYVGCGLIDEIDAFLSTYAFKRVITRFTQHGWGDALYIIHQ
jgi:uncharacterized protein YunC (DUF1805 family)